MKYLDVVKQILIYDLENRSNLNTAKKGKETGVHLSSAFRMAHCLNQEQFNLEGSHSHSLGELFLIVWKELQETVLVTSVSSLSCFCFVSGQNSGLELNISFTVMIPRLLFCHLIKLSGPGITGR